MKDHFKNIDHVAIAVRDLDSAIDHYVNILGFDLIESRTTKGMQSSMRSAVMGFCDSSFTTVLVQGCEPESQVSKFIENHGCGVQHVAIEVDDLEKVVSRLGKKGISWATKIISGREISQIFTKRCEKSGVMYEFIQRSSRRAFFLEENVNDLFRQLEEAGTY